jgi:hypothetical protein
MKYFIVFRLSTIIVMCAFVQYAALAQSSCENRTWDGPVSDAMKRICGDKTEPQEPSWKIIHPITLDDDQLEKLPAFIQACKAMKSSKWIEKEISRWNISCENGSRLER